MSFSRREFCYHEVASVENRWISSKRQIQVSFHGYKTDQYSRKHICLGAPMLEVEVRRKIVALIDFFINIKRKIEVWVAPVYGSHKIGE